MKIGIITDCNDIYEKITNVFDLEDTAFILVKEKKQVENLDGVIIYFSSDNYFARIIDCLLCFKSMPTMFLWVGISHLEREEQRILLEMGVNNVLSFPEDLEKLNYIIKNMFSRLSMMETLVKEKMVDHSILNESNQSIVIDNEERSLTGMEYKVLSLLVSKMNSTVTYEEIAKSIWLDLSTEKKEEIRPKVANVVFHVREKIKLSNFDIVTTRGKGYVFTKNEVEC